ncbi:PDT-domain-containing protein [Lophiostoma macrostomum CBS 122681]|uniref:prephenate dehydratase n=1 Tax=Lophiostoma macrostomum CBS 122681 TaxID=1314788 RepID=A0A6A6TGV7_9PLEO|nr:PDT-domain-containing protein [Lophiostoma macrostomum CBS 122681]
MAEDKKPEVAFLGPKASYTHQATLDTFPENSYTHRPEITIEDVFSSVQSGTAYRGVVPFENSTNGSVVFTLDLFADMSNKYPDILVCGESYIPVSHCLLARHPSPSKNASVIDSPLSSGAATPTSRDPTPAKPLTAPLGDISGIKKLYSHPQAWGQCKAFLNTYLKGVERHDVSSTSRAAELVSLDASGESAAISSGIAARVFGLGVLARGIEERGDNCTRFFVLRKKGEEASGEVEAEKTQTQDPNPSYKTLISFTVDHSNPGALANSLAVFARHGLNLTSINTRPSGVENWNYIFFVEVSGSSTAGIEDGRGGNGGAVDLALRDLKEVCRGCRWLGSWENRLQR